MPLTPTISGGCGMGASVEILVRFEIASFVSTPSWRGQPMIFRSSTKAPPKACAVSRRSPPPPTQGVRRWDGPVLLAHPVAGSRTPSVTVAPRTTRAAVPLAMRRLAGYARPAEPTARGLHTYRTVAHLAGPSHPAQHVRQSHSLKRRPTGCARPTLRTPPAPTPAPAPRRDPAAAASTPPPGPSGCSRPAARCAGPPRPSSRP